jgi:hypothetical protein
VRVEIVVHSQRPLRATVINDPRFSANFYYLLDGPHPSEPVEVLGFNTIGARVFRHIQ